MQIRNVRLESIVADENNPRQDFGDLDALAASFAGNGGQPWNPPIVVADGSIFRIVDGERRIRAMRSLGEGAPEEVACVVCEGMDERDAAVAMVATDDKRRLTDEEKSRGTQQMLLLGVDDDVIDAAAHLAPGSARRARRGRSVAGDAGDQMTFDRLFAIGEFAEAGDDEAAAAILDAEDGKWRFVADSRKRLSRNRATARAAIDALAGVGIGLVGERPLDMTHEYTLSPWKNIPKAVESHDWPEGCVAYAEVDDGMVTVYAPSSDAVDAEAEERAIAAQAKADELAAAVESVEAFVYESILSGGPLPNVGRWALDRVWATEGYSAPQFVRRAKEDGKELRMSKMFDYVSGLPLAVVIGNRMPTPAKFGVKALFLGELGGMTTYEHDKAVDWAAVYAAALADGFELDPELQPAVDAYVEWANSDDWKGEGKDGDE
ncbi:hypothetical protein AAY81_00825 [Denitrobacterium detoxificans]|nr:ParB/RepB/Spo0J family partition protein [Denitrobacterium detoxificans]ANE21949.1 hypothetical protein AAY81_00825 [Denitrobacterium detoxificans]